jgi:hypothetical protein
MEFHVCLGGLSRTLRRPMRRSAIRVNERLGDDTSNGTAGMKEKGVVDVIGPPLGSGCSDNGVKD